MSAEIHHEMIAHAHAGLPLEACGLFAGSVGTDEDATVARFYPTENEAASSKVCTVLGKSVLRAARAADDLAAERLGDLHAHRARRARRA